MPIKCKLVNPMHLAIDFKRFQTTEIRFEITEIRFEIRADFEISYTIWKSGRPLSLSKFKVAYLMHAPPN